MFYFVYFLPPAGMNSCTRVCVCVLDKARDFLPLQVFHFLFSLPNTGLYWVLISP